MVFLKGLLTNRVLIAGLTAWLIAQIAKAVIAWITDKKFSPERLIGDGGMPSCHSALVTAVAVMSGYVCGVDSPVFALALMVAFIVMHDAMGVRRETGKQAVVIQDIVNLINDMFQEKDRAIRNEKLKILVGHSPVQVVFGSLVGALVALAHILLLRAVP